MERDNSGILMSHWRWGPRLACTSLVIGLGVKWKRMSWGSDSGRSSRHDCRTTMFSTSAATAFSTRIDVGWPKSATRRTAQAELLASGLEKQAVLDELARLMQPSAAEPDWALSRGMRIPDGTLQAITWNARALLGADAKPHGRKLRYAGATRATLGSALCLPCHNVGIAEHGRQPPRNSGTRTPCSQPTSSCRRRNSRLSVRRSRMASASLPNSACHDHMLPTTDKAGLRLHANRQAANPAHMAVRKAQMCNFIQSRLGCAIRDNQALAVWIKVPPMDLNAAHIRTCDTSEQRRWLQTGFLALGATDNKIPTNMEIEQTASTPKSKCQARSQPRSTMTYGGIMRSINLQMAKVIACGLQGRGCRHAAERVG